MKIGLESDDGPRSESYVQVMSAAAGASTSRTRSPALVIACRHPTLVDAGISGGLAAAAMVSAHAVIRVNDQIDPGFRRPSTAVLTVAMLLVTVPLTWRRRTPIPVCAASIAAFVFGRVVLEIGEASISLLAISLAMYSVAAHAAPPWRTPAVALAWAVVVGELVRELFWFDSDIDGLAWVQSFILAYNMAILALPWVLGVALRSLRERESQLSDVAEMLYAQRAENARRAVYDERVRIARELHDVIAHYVSVMGIQAGAARRVLSAQPERATDALESIETTSREAITELQRMLGFLRRDDDVDERSPQPGLAELDQLTEHVRAAGLDLQLSVAGDPRPLPPSTDVSAYRIVQEALTNTLKHAGATRAAVTLRYLGEQLEIDVTDNGRRTSPTPKPVPGGHGLIGMRERVNLHGGTLVTGPLDGGGFRVRAVLPLQRELT